MSDQPMAPIEPLCIDPVQLSHATPEVPIHRLDKQVVMAGHLAWTTRLKRPHTSPRDRRKRAPIPGLEENVLPPVTPGRDVVKSAGVL